MKFDTFKPIKLFFRYMLQHPWLFAGSLMLGPGAVLMNIISPLFIAHALGQLTAHHHANLSLVLYSGLAFAGGATLYFIADRYFGIRLHNATLQKMYDDCFAQLLRQDYDFFANNFSGALVTQANRFVKSYEQFHMTFFLDLLGQLSGVFTAIAISLYYNVYIGLLLGLLWLASVTLVAFLTAKRMPVRRAAVAQESRQTAELADTVTNAVTVQTFAAEAYEVGRYGRTNRKTRHLFHESWRRGIRNNYIVGLLSCVLQVTILFAGIRAVENGSISFATFLLFQVYALQVIGSISKASLSVRFIEGILGDAHEMTELFERTSAVQDPAKPETPHIDKGSIDFRAVDFGYDNASDDQALFKNLNLHIKPGERVGLVGPSGGGKTTITKLLLRFMDVQSGAIAIDGQDIRSIKQADLHRAISYVPQEPLLFHRSLAENIRYGRPEASDEEIVAAAKRAHAHEFISKLPKGYDTLVGERGIKLSGGQRQRVAIARAMLKNAPLLVLDEATSALDSESERYIQKALWELMQGKTTVVIAHRLSTIQHLDRIIALNEGTIVEEGTHDSLLKQDGLYAKLWAHQSGGFIEE